MKVVLFCSGDYEFSNKSKFMEELAIFMGFPYWYEENEKYYAWTTLDRNEYTKNKIKMDEDDFVEFVLEHSLNISLFTNKIRCDPQVIDIFERHNKKIIDLEKGIYEIRVDGPLCDERVIQIDGSVIVVK